MEPFVQVDESYFLIKSWQRINNKVLAGFTTRMGGYSKKQYTSFNLGLHVLDNEENVKQNRKRLAEKIQIPLQQWVFTEQVHGTNIKLISHQNLGSGTIRLDTAIKKTDGLITNHYNVVCAQAFADCVPLFFYHPGLNLVAIAHSGWKGTVFNIAQKMIDQFSQFGACKTDIHVVIGPAIQQDSYEVGKEIIEHLSNTIVHDVAIQKSNGQFSLDLPYLNELFLIKAGIKPSNIQRSHFCTYKNENLFFSHRRDKGKTGRMLGFIALKQ